jgi:hypothetical protein
LSKEHLEKYADLIVRGTVIEVKVGEPKPRAYGKEYYCELTVRVAAVDKGKFERDATLEIWGSYDELKPGYCGDSGDSVMSVAKPGWELTLYLTGPTDGVYRIVGPNGYFVVAMPPEEAPWWLLVGIAILGAILLTGLARYGRSLSRVVARAIHSGTPMRFSIGGWVMFAGAIFGLLSSFLPGNVCSSDNGYTWQHEALGDCFGGEWVMWYSIVALILAGFLLRIREARYSDPSDYAVIIAAHLGAVFLGLLLVLAGRSVIFFNDISEASRAGWGVYVLFAAGLIVCGGALSRFVEQLRFLPSTTGNL